MPAAVLAQSAFQVLVQEGRADARTGVAVLVAAQPGPSATLLTTSELVDAGRNTQYFVFDAQTGAQVVAQVEANNTESNLALLSVPGLEGAPTTLALEASGQGRQVQLQLPEGGARDGHLHSQIERNGRTFYRFSVQAQTGEAGAPVMNNCGELLSLARDPGRRGWNREDQVFGMGRELAVLKDFLSAQGVAAEIAADVCPSVEELRATAEAERDALEEQRAQLEEEASLAAAQAERLAEIEAEKAELETQIEQQQEELSQHASDLAEKERLQNEWAEELQRRQDDLDDALVEAGEAAEEAQLLGQILRYGGAAAGALLLIFGAVAWTQSRARKRNLEMSNQQIAVARDEVARSNVAFSDLVLAGHGPECGEVRLKINGSAVARSADGQVLGRSSSSADYFVNSRSVSRRHARLFVQDDQLLVEDLGSLNGTRVDGAESTPGKPLPLSEGSTLDLGDVALSASFLGDYADEAP